MAYRKIKEEKRIHRVLQDISTENRTLVQNGATAYLAVPCWYQEVDMPRGVCVYDRDSEDHIGWPNPYSPDASSQAKYSTPTTQYVEARHVYTHEKDMEVKRMLDIRSMHPVHLRDEGYTGVEVSFLDPPDGLTAEGWIDETDDWVVRFLIHPMCQSAKAEDVDVRYTVFVTGASGSRQRRDVVAAGTLRILAGPIGQGGIA